MSQLIGALFSLISVICTIIVLIDAFKTSLLKGLLSFFCCIYYVWYALVEFQHENKLLIVLGSFFGGGVGGVLTFLRH